MPPGPPKPVLFSEIALLWMGEFCAMENGSGILLTRWPGDKKKPLPWLKAGICEKPKLCIDMFVAFDIDY